VDWAQADEFDCEPEVQDKSTFFPDPERQDQILRKGRGESDRGRKLITPSYLKDISGNVLLIEIWAKALDALRNAHARS
jgi:hypothetical protein